MNADPISVLLAEDEPSHVEAIRRALENTAMAVDLRVVASLGEYRAAVSERKPDVALMDLNLQDGRSESALTSPPEQGAFPIVVMTSHGDETTAVAAMRAGALDYIVKSSEAFAQMPLSIERALREWALRMERQRAEAALRDREARYRAVTETSADGFVMIDGEGRLLDVNEAYVRLSGYSREELLGVRVGDLDARESTDEIAARLATLRDQGSDIFETQHRKKDGTVWQAEVDLAHWSIEGGLNFVFIRDVTRRKRADYLMRIRAQIASEAASRTADELLQLALDQMELLTGSSIGFIHFVDPDQQHLRLQAWSTRTLKTMCTAEGKGRHYAVDDAGVWAECMRTKAPAIHNDYASLPNRKGMPEGHAEIVRELVVPVISGGLVTAVVGVGNKKTEYTQEDVEGVEAVAAMVVDLALRKQTEYEFEHFFELVPDLVCIVSDDGYFHRLNSRWEQVLGHTRREMMSRPFLSFVHPDDRADTAKVFEAEKREGRAVAGFVNRYQARDGSWHWLEWNATPMADDRLIFAAARDVTQRREQEEAIRRSAQWMVLYVQNTPLAVIEWDVDFRVREWNPAAERIFGFSKAEALGRHYSLIVPDSARAAVDKTGDDLINQQGGTQLTNENVTKDGRIIMCEWFNTTLVDAQAKTIGVASLVQDVTARHSLEVQLRQSQKLEAVGQLAGGVAHDYNNILAAMMMNIGMLQERTDLDAEVRQTVEELNTLTQRSAALTRQLLMFSRRSVLTIRTLDLNHVIQDVMKMLQRLIGEQISFRFAGEPDLPSIRADSGMIEQIATNLCVNARDAMPKGGGIVMRTSTAVIDAGRARLHPDAKIGRFVCLSVADTGSGMSPEIMHRVFEPFFTTKDPGKGTGLGLSTVFGIAKQHGGWVEVESAVGLGSTFRVYLPAGVDVVADSSASTKSAGKGGHETILLVEDDEAVRKMMTTALKRYGYHVLAAASGPDAIEVFERSGSDIALLFTDMVMPGGMTGLDLAAVLREKKPELKAIVTSGYSADLVGASALADSRVRFLSKPVPFEELIANVRKILDQ